VAGKFRVSYVVATKDRLKTIRAAMPMWRRLKGRGDEFIVVDGGSTDGSQQFLRQAGSGLVDRLISEPDRSESHALSKGFLLARGEWIKPMTDDDIFFPEALEKAYQTMSWRPEIDVLITGGEFVNGLRGSGSDLPTDFQWYPDTLSPRDGYTYSMMCGEGMVVRRSSLALTGLSDPRHVEADCSFLTQAFLRGAVIRYLRVKGFRHILNEESISQVRRQGAIKFSADIFKDFHCPVSWRWNLWARRSRLKYVIRPWGLWRPLARRLGIREGWPKEPPWDGKVL
jgi:glycosyltransferase involved in cell wall biosynthesis